MNDIIINITLLLGLRIAPPEAPISGFMFGKGVYFADMFSKSANYCCASEACKSGVMLLCEVCMLYSPSWYYMLKTYSWKLCSLSLFWFIGCVIYLLTSIIHSQFQEFGLFASPPFNFKLFTDIIIFLMLVLTYISQVALGEMNELLYGDFGADNLPNGKLRSVSHTIISKYFSWTCGINFLLVNGSIHSSRYTRRCTQPHSFVKLA